MARYDRQQLLPQIGPQGQDRLAKSRLLLVGCGALGSVAAELLARAGVGFLRIVDRDLVELTNLQRQILFDERDAAEQIPKSIAAARRLKQINHEVEIDPIVADANAANIESFADVDLIVDGTDNIATRYLLNDVAVKHEIPWIYGGCVGVEGRVWPIFPKRTACLRCLFPDPPSAHEMPTCDTAGVLGPAAAIVGALQASAAIRFLIESSPGPPLPPSPGTPGDLRLSEAKSRPVGSGGEGRVSTLLSFNAWTHEFRTLPSASTPNPHCPCCSAGKFPYLSTDARDFTTNLCGSRAVQVIRSAGEQKIDLTATARRWEKIGTVGLSPWFVRCKLHDPPGIDLTLFPDGRLIVHGTNEPTRAKSLYARFVGS
jgi:molybdopterin/thiamine biosynthesis adenylyltransferase